MGVCIFASAGANWIPDAHDTGSFFSGKSLMDLAISAGTVLVLGYSGKAMGGWLASVKGAGLVSVSRAARK
jgi:hypothetical protein